MNAYLDPAVAKRSAAPLPREAVARRSSAFPRLKRTPFIGLTLRRLLRGGRLNDAGRLPRYFLVVALFSLGIWLPVGGYLAFAPEQFTSSVSLILPGTGVSSSVSLSEIGQASTSANSPYASSSISPTVTYQKLMQSGRVADRAVKLSGIDPAAFGRPRVKLVDQTSLMQVEMKGATPQEAQARSEAILEAFLKELDDLRNDEMSRREASVTDTVRKYQEGVDRIRDRISALQLETGLSSTDQFAGIVKTKEDLLSAIAENEAELERVAKSVESLAGLLDMSPEAAAQTIKLNADPEYETLSHALSEEGAKLASLEKLYGPRHPEVMTVKRRHLGIRAKMLDRAMLVTGLDIELLQDEVQRATDGRTGELLSTLISEVVTRDGLSGRLAVLRSKLEVNQHRIAEMVDAASKLDKLNRDYKVAEAVFTSALARLNASKTDFFASYPMVQVAEPPSLPWEPSSPNRLLAIAAGCAATLFMLIGLGLTWIRRPLIDRLTGGARFDPDELDATA